MATPITIFRSSSGIDVKTDPTRINFDPQTGVQNLAVAVNIDHDRSGRVSRRKGFSATAITSHCHSLWCDGGACLFVTGSNLCSLAGDFSATVLVAVTPGARVSYFQLGPRSFWANGYEAGIVENNANGAWDKGQYVGPTTNRHLIGPPIGHLIAYAHGRVWIAQGSVLWYSEPYATNLFDSVRGLFPFESRITMLHPVKRGIFVSDQNRVHFISGTDPKQAELITVADYPAIEGTACRLDIGKFADGSISASDITGAAVVFAASEGICIGTHDGRLFNITRNKLTYPLSLRGSGLIIDSRYIALLEP